MRAYYADNRVKLLEAKKKKREEEKKKREEKEKFSPSIDCLLILNFRIN